MIFTAILLFAALSTCAAFAAIPWGMRSWTGRGVAISLIYTASTSVALATYWLLVRLAAWTLLAV